MKDCALIDQARAAGVELQLADGKIRAAGERGAVALLLESLRLHKAEVIAALTGAAETAKTAETAPPANWPSLHSRYMVHHWLCPACIGGGQDRGERCGPGAAMWTAYAEAVGARGAAWLSEAFEERAAIMEFDGGMTRADAEAAARLEL